MPPPPVQARAAWITLGSLTVPLDNWDGGWACTSLDLGQPEVREVKNNRPDQHGVIDRTQYLGGRVVTATITAFPGGTLPMDQAIEQFAPFMDPSQRPVLHVTTVSSAPERTLVLRASPYSGGMPMSSMDRRDAQFQWVAGDPVLRAVTLSTATSWSGLGGGGSGRLYPLTHPRVYPAAGGSQVNGVIVGYGAIIIRPTLTVYGPITTPRITFRTASGQVFQVWFTSGYQLAAGHYITIDTVNRTATLDGTTNAATSVDWVNSIWPALPNSPDQTTMILSGDPTGLVTSGVTQVQATWQDGFLA
jgi:hypothetical protein